MGTHFSERRYKLDHIDLLPCRKHFTSSVVALFVIHLPCLCIINMQVGLLNHLPAFLLTHWKLICDKKHKWDEQEAGDTTFLTALTQGQKYT